MTATAACGSSPDDDEGAGGGDSAFTIQMVADLTGGGVVFHQATVNGVKSAIKKINADGGVDGRTIDLTIIDGRSTSEGAQSGIRKAMSAKPDLMILGILSSGVTAAVPVINSSDVPILSAAGIDDLLFPPAKNFFSLGTTSYQQASFAFEKARQAMDGSLQGKRVAFEGISTPAIQQIFTQAAPMFEGAGATIVTSPVALRPGDATTFASQAQKIVSSKADIVVTFESEPGMLIVANALKTAGFNGPLLGGVGTNTAKVFETIASDSYLAARESAAVEPGSEQAQAATAAGVDTAGGYWGTGWSLAYLASEALSACKDTCSGDAIREHLESVGDITIPGDALFGPVRFGSDKHYGLTAVQYYKYDTASTSVVKDGDPVDVSQGAPPK